MELLNKLMIVRIKRHQSCRFHNLFPASCIWFFIFSNYPNCSSVFSYYTHLVVSSSPSQSTNVLHSSVVGQINLPSLLGHGSTVISTSQKSTRPNTNPLRFIQGNIRICQGCRSSLRSQDGSIPVPPFDMVIARAEQRSFRDKNGKLVIPHQEQTCCYHFLLNFIRAVEPNFVPMALQVPQDVFPLLTVIHREYLHLVFELSFQ